MSQILEKFVGREVEWDKNAPENLEQHQKINGGLIRFRFPPEPNGYLHLGHAKSMNLNFGLVEKLRREGLKASCYLRFDDTNPEKESTEYTTKIIETVNWLGWRPDEISYSSDYFEELYEMATVLIEKGLAYVDFSSSEEIAVQRKQKIASPFRGSDNGDVKLTLDLFENMAKGIYHSLDNPPTLRLKIDIHSENPNMWDPIAYRIKKTPHHRTGDRWKIYPSYDFSHCLVDSFEHIDYSLCTLEFETRREPYYWILDQLNLYKPRVWEFSRLNMEKSTLSKRDINEFICRQQVESWSDPRLLTLLGMRRRGFTPQAINQFCETIGLTRNENELQIALLENILRDNLNQNCLRRLAILDPLEVEILNYDDIPRTFMAKNHPLQTELGTRTLFLDHKIIYIERSDFRLEDSKDFYGLAPNPGSTTCSSDPSTTPTGGSETTISDVLSPGVIKPKVVGLKYGPNLIYHHHQVDTTTGKVSKLFCSVDYEKLVKPKTHIQWLVENHYQSVKMVVFDYLLDKDKQINPNSITVFPDSKIESGLSLTDYQTYQFERLGYFVSDRENPGTFLMTIGLKAQKG